MDCTISELISHFNNVLLKHLKYTFITNHQFQFIREIKILQPKMKLLSMVLEFSQNYKCKYIKEIHNVPFE